MKIWPTPSPILQRIDCLSTTTVYDDRMVVESFWAVYKIPQFASARCYKWLKNLAKTRRKHFNKMHKSDCNVENMSIQVLEKKKITSYEFFFNGKSSWMSEQTIKSFHLFEPNNPMLLVFAYGQQRNLLDF